MGSQFSKEYIKGKKLGEGGFGEVYKCIRKKDNQDVAVKILAKKIMSEQDLLRVPNERDLLKQAKHMNIISFYDFLEDSEYFYIIMELANGGTLKQFKSKRASKGKPLTEDEVLRIFYQVLRGVAFLHENNIIHRDIKPDNIFIDKNGHIKLGDLGVSKKISSAQNPIELNQESSKFHSIEIESISDLDSSTSSIKHRISVAHRSSVYGTPGYGAPEFMNLENYGYNSDVWSLGKVLQELCKNLKSEKLEKLQKSCLIEDKNERSSVDDLLKMCKNLSKSKSEKDTKLKEGEQLSKKLRWTDSEEYKYNQEYPILEKRNILNDIVGISVNDYTCFQIITRDMERSSFPDSKCFGGWQYHVIPQGTIIAKIDMINAKASSWICGIKFYDKNSAVLLSVGRIDDPNYRQNPDMAITSLTLQEDERLIGVKSCGNGLNRAHHFNLRWVICKLNQLNGLMPNKSLIREEQFLAGNLLGE